MVHEPAFGLDVDPATRAMILIEERLRQIDEKSAERDRVVDRIEATVSGQQNQINQVVIDMAVLKSQNSTFWKGAAAVMSMLTLLGTIAGWALSHFVTH